VPSSTAPSKKVTVPEGLTATPESVAVKVTDEPWTMDLAVGERYLKPIL
jgi:hypothetical protein